MNLTLFLPWFPIILAVGVGGRLLGRTRGYALGLLCALFWVVLIQTAAGAAVWRDGWIMASILAGTVAIVAMGGWAGESALTEAAKRQFHSASKADMPAAKPQAGDSVIQAIGESLHRFDEWLEDYRNESNPWPAFDEFIRGVLFQCCRATHVRPYRAVAGGDELIPLRDPDPATDVVHLSAHDGLAGHVMTTGRSFLVEDPLRDAHAAHLAQSAPERPVWCFPITNGPKRVGVVFVGRLHIVPSRNRALIRAVEHLISQFWRGVLETINGRTAALHDQVSGLLTREAFLRQSEGALRESYHQGEPVAAAVIALERLRTLNDSGKWEIADALVREVSAILRRKVRADDRVGRFDGSRFVVFFRRVDGELAAMIADQIMTRLRTLCSDTARWQVPIAVRCGVVGSSGGTPTLRSLVSDALLQCRRARIEKTLIATDLPAPTSSTGNR